MQTYIALLRGINVSGHKKILMADLKLLFQDLGFSKVKTYIQSGNVVFQSTENFKFSEKISEAIKHKYGWDVPVMVKTSAELSVIFKASPFTSEELEQSYFILLSQKPEQDYIEAFQQLNYPSEEFYIINACVYTFYKKGAGNAKLTTNLMEKKLKVSATARNYRTMTKLLDLAQTL